MRNSIARKPRENQAASRTNPEKQQQIELDLFAHSDTSPSGHFIALTARDKCETSIVFTPLEEKRWHKLSIDDESDFNSLCDQINTFAGRKDVYITVNEFWRWRTIANLRRLNACYVDIDDCPYPDSAGLKQLYMLENLGWPMPNLIVRSGRGAHFYWLFDAALPSYALPRWQHLQKRLVAALSGDPCASDAARVLRLAGTINSKNGRHVTAQVYHGSRYSFEHLFEQIAQTEYLEARRKPKASVTDIRKGAADRGKRPATSSIGTRWYLVYMDLRYIVQSVFNGVIPEAEPNKKGHRNNFIYLYCVALSWFTVSDALDDEIIEVASIIAPTLTRSEVLGYTSSVRNRAEFDAKKLKEDPNWESKALNKSRYRYKRETLYNLLKGYITPEMIPHLRAIIPDDVAKARKIERKTERRHEQAGGNVRAYGKRNQGKREQAWIYHCDGYSVRQIAEMLDVGTMSASRWIRAKIAETEQSKTGVPIWSLV